MRSGGKVAAVQRTDADAVHIEEFHADICRLGKCQGDGISDLGKARRSCNNRVVNSCDIIFVVEDYFDFGNLHFRVAEAAGEGIVFVCIEIEEGVRSGDKVVIKEGARVACRVIGHDDAESLVSEMSNEQVFFSPAATSQGSAKLSVHFHADVSLKIRCSWAVLLPLFFTVKERVLAWLRSKVFWYSI